MKQISIPEKILKIKNRDEWQHALSSTVIPWTESLPKETLQAFSDWYNENQIRDVIASPHCRACEHFREDAPFCGYCYSSCEIYGSLDQDQHQRHPDISARTCPDYEQNDQKKRDVVQLYRDAALKPTWFCFSYSTFANMLHFLRGEPWEAGLL